MSRPASRLAKLAERPRAAIALCVVLTCLLVPGISCVGFEEDLRALFPADFEEVQALATYRDTFGAGDSLLLLLRSQRGRDYLLAAGDLLAAELAQRLPHTRVHHRIDAATKEFLQETFQDHAFLYLPPDALAGARARLTPAGIDTALDRAVARLEATSDPTAEERFLLDPIGLGEDFFFPAFRRSAGALVDVQSGAVLDRSGTALLIRVEGVRHAQDVPYSKSIVSGAAAAVAAMRAGLAAQGRPGDVRVERAGGYFAAVVNEAGIKGDMVLTTITSVIGVLVLFALAFPPAWRGRGGSAWRRLLAPHLLVVLPLGLGVAWTAGVTGYVVGDVTMITAAFIAVLVGLSVDFPIHLLARYRDARARGDGVAALRTALGGTGAGVVAAALTTAGGFAVLAGSRFRALSEMGTLTAAGLLLCLLAVFATAAVLYPRVEPADRVPLRDGLARLGGMPRPLAIVILVAAGVCSVVAAVGLWRRPLAFQEDVRRLATPNPEARATQAAMAEAFGLSSDPLLLLTHAADADAAADEAARLGEALLPLQRDGRIALAFGPAVLCPSRARVAANAAALAGVDAGAVASHLRAALAARDFDPADFTEAIGRLERAIRGSVAGDLTPARVAGHGDLWKQVVRRTPTGGAAVIVVQPAAGTDRAALAAAIAGAVARTAPHTQVATIHRIVDRLHAELIPEMTRLGGFAALAVAALTLLALRHPGWAAAALMPVALGLLWTLGGMAWFGLPLTFFNVCAGPLILGMGVDDGIHLVSRHREADRPGPRATLGAVGVPVVLTSATTCLGFGSLMLAGNGGLVSLGQTAALGVAACFAATIGPLSAILVLHRPPGGDEGTP